jgi:hypothetical protein
MAYNDDWLPGARAAVLNMCRVWLIYLTLERQTAWGILAADYAALGTLFGAAQALLQKAEDDAERTHVVTVELQEAFGALEAKMRYFRNRYFTIPPLTVGDWAALGFRAKDPSPTPIPRPQGTPVALLSYLGGPHALGVRLEPVAGTEPLNPASDYGYALYVGIMPPGGATLEEAASEKHYLRAPPKDGKGLQHYCFSRRRKGKIIFDAEDSGKTAYVCPRYENRKGEVGLWGPVTSAVIP